MLEINQNTKIKLKATSAISKGKILLISSLELNPSARAERIFNIIITAIISAKTINTPTPAIAVLFT